MRPALRRGKSTASRRVQRASPRAIDPHALALTRRAEQFFKALGVSSAAVLVDITDDNTILACAQGATWSSMAVGKITISRVLLELYDADELDFVLAHEVAHIYRNHLAARFTFAAARAIVDSLAREDRAIKELLALWTLWTLIRAATGGLPPDAAQLKQNELEADAWAVWLTGCSEAPLSMALKAA